MTTSSHATETLKVASLSIEPDVTVRSIKSQDGYVDGDTVAQYTEALEAGAEFPAIRVFRVPEGDLLVTDGFHRVAAHKQLGRDEITAIVLEGTRDEAQIDAATANATHGRPLTRHEYKNAALRLLGLGVQAAETARRLYRSKSWIKSLEDMLAVEQSVPVKLRAGITDESQLAAMFPAGRAVWPHLCAVLQSSGWTVEQTRKAAKLVAENAEALETLHTAARDGLPVAVKGDTLEILPKDSKATPAGRENAKNGDGDGDGDDGDGDAQTGESGGTDAQTGATSNAQTDAPTDTDAPRTPDIPAVLNQSVNGAIELEGMDDAAIVETVPNGARKDRAAMLRRAANRLNAIADAMFPVESRGNRNRNRNGN